MFNPVFTPFPILTTSRLILRKIEPLDKEQIFKLRSDEQVNKYLDRPVAKTVEDAEAFINKILGFISTNEACNWAINLKNQPGLIGTFALYNISKERASVEIGYELLPQYQGRGLMKEATERIIQFAFDDIKASIIEGYTTLENLASIKLMEGLGFKRDEEAESKFKSEGGPSNMVIYSLRNGKNSI